MKEKIKYYDYSSLHGMINRKSSVGNVFIFDDVNSIDENFQLYAIISKPIRLGMVAGIICKKGYIKLRVGLNDFTVSPNMLMIILSEQIIQLIEVSPDFEACYILIRKGFFEIQNDFKMGLDLQTNLFNNPCVQLSETEMEEVLVIFYILKNKVEENTDLFLKEVIQNYIRALFYIACNIFFKSNEKAIKTRKEEIFEKFISLLAQNFRQEQNIGWYAEKFYLTPKYLSKIIFEVSGKHAGDWIKDYIILEAQALLNSSSLTIQQISDELGFSNQSHFGSYFKRYVGVAPKEYKGKG